MLSSVLETQDQEVRVHLNIAESRRARESSNFSEHIRRTGGHHGPPRPNPHQHPHVRDWSDRSRRSTVQVSEWRRPITRDQISDLREDFLGRNFVRVEEGKWRSIDGTRQFRVNPDDFSWNGQGHGMGNPVVSNQSHVHLEFLIDNATGTGFRVIKNIHIPIIGN